MSKINKLQNEIDDLEHSKEEAELLIKKADMEIREHYNLIAEEYRNFYINKKNKQFTLIDRFPNIQALNTYIARNKNFPLYLDGKLSVTELAEIIKCLFQFTRQKNYELLTIGTTERDCESTYGGKSFSVKPHLFFLIGDDKTLEPFYQYNGKFVNNERVYNDIFLRAKGKNIICIEADRIWTYYNENRLNIECSIDTNLSDQGINYYDFEDGCYKNFMASGMKNVFSESIRGNLTCARRPSIKDVFDFKIDYNDTFIAKILISIIIYKRNNGIERLTEEDYNHIFRTLFNEEVDIKGEAEKDIPKQLVYRPHLKENPIFIMDPKK